MMKISILYPNQKGSLFHKRYYVGTHMPLSLDLLSTHPGSKGFSVERRLGGAEPGTDPAYQSSPRLAYGLQVVAAP